jgi:hypothetical protein
VTGRSLVVDASVARQAGNTTTSNAMSVQCRDVLLEIEKNGHKVVISAGIRREWKNHASTYSWHWLTNMISRERHLAVDPTPCRELRRVINALPGADQEAAKKDLVLTEAALDSDYRVVSRDNKMATILRRVATSVPKVGAIHWVNPESGECLPWIIAGAADNPSLQLLPAASHAAHSRRSGSGPAGQ